MKQTTPSKLIYKNCSNCGHPQKTWLAWIEVAIMIILLTWVIFAQAQGYYHRTTIIVEAETGILKTHNEWDISNLNITINEVTENGKLDKKLLEEKTTRTSNGK